MICSLCKTKLSRPLNPNHASKHTKKSQTQETKPTFKSLLRLTVKTHFLFFKPSSLPYSFSFRTLPNENHHKNLSKISQKLLSKTQKNPLKQTPWPLFIASRLPLDHLPALMNGQDLIQRTTQPEFGNCQRLSFCKTVLYQDSSSGAWKLSCSVCESVRKDDENKIWVNHSV